MRRRLRVEMLVVLGISLGQSAVYALLSLINKLTQEVALNRQTTSINASKTPDRPWLDLVSACPPPLASMSSPPPTCVTGACTR